MTADIKKSIKETIDEDYMRYAMYVLENRAIPCYIDGMKPVHRKLFYAMLNEHRGRKTKVSDLGGISKYNYHHGESSAMGAAITLTADWNNNVPLFKGHGNFGSRLIQDAAAPRYIFASLNPEIEKYFTDYEVCDSNIDEDNPEPQTYLPNIPWVLVNGIEGIAVGFACRYLPHQPKDIAKACLLAVQNKLKDDYIIPVSFPGFSGEIIQESPTKVVTRGVVNRVKRNTWQITEAPWGFDREQLFNLLDKMSEAGKIVDFDDNCDDSGFNFTVKLDSASDAKCQVDPIAYFKLEKAFTENYTALDEEGKLRIFDSKIDIVRSFVDYRIKKLCDKINYDLNKAQGRLDYLSAKLKLITAVVNREIDLRDFKKAQLISWLVTDAKASEEDATKLAGIPISDMTTDQINSLSAQIKQTREDISILKSTDPVVEYSTRLKEIK